MAQKMVAVKGSARRPCAAQQGWKFTARWEFLPCEEISPTWASEARQQVLYLLAGKWENPPD